jgi:hypothetical protein
MAMASESAAQPLNLTHHWVGYLAIAIFSVAYILAMTEEVTHLNKSKPMVLAASLIWMFIAAIYVSIRTSLPGLPGRLCRTIFIYYGIDGVFKRHGRSRCI